jgi:hypothetical protein
MSALKKYPPEVRLPTHACPMKSPHVVMLAGNNVQEFRCGRP